MLWPLLAHEGACVNAYKIILIERQVCLWNGQNVMFEKVKYVNCNRTYYNTKNQCFLNTVQMK